MSQPIVVIGAGGHAKVIVEILEELECFDIRGCTSAASGTTAVLGYPVLGTDEVLPALYSSGVRHVFVAIGDNRARGRVMGSVAAMGFTLVRAISRRAIVSRRAVVGDGVAIMAGAVINADSEIGAGAVINTGATVDHDCRIGEAVHIAPGVNLAGNVSVGAGAFLGIGCRVLPGIKIGEWAMVGAGAVVIRDVPAGETVVGVPATPLKR